MSVGNKKGSKGKRADSRDGERKRTDDDGKKKRLTGETKNSPEGAALAVARDDPRHARVLEHLGADLAGEGAVGLEPAVLGGHLRFPKKGEEGKGCVERVLFGV